MIDLFATRHNNKVPASYVSNTRQTSVEGGCPVHRLEPPVCVCVSSEGTVKSGFEEDSAIRMSDTVDSTNVAKTDLVSAAVGVVSGKTNQVASRTFDAQAAEVINNTQESTDAKVTCVNIIKGHGKRRDFLKQQPTEWQEHSAPGKVENFRCLV